MITLSISHSSTNQTTKQKHLWKNTKISSQVTGFSNLFTLFKQQYFIATSSIIIQTQVLKQQYILLPVILLKIDKKNR